MQKVISLCKLYDKIHVPSNSIVLAKFEKRAAFSFLLLQ